MSTVIAKFVHRFIVTSFSISTFSVSTFAITPEQKAFDEEQEIKIFEQNYQNLLLNSHKGLGSILYGDLIIKKVFNFGVVVNNPNYLIYRSALLGNKGLKYLSEHLNKQNLPFPKTIIYLNKQGYNALSLPVIGDFAIEEYIGQEKYNYRFFHSFDDNFRTYVDGHNPYQPSEDIDSQTSYLFDLRAQYLFPLRPHPEKDGNIETFVKVLETVLNPANQPVLFHCFGGRHRTGMVGLALRYLQGGNWIHGKKREVRLQGGKTLQLNPAQYEYYKHNKTTFREDNLSFIEEFAKDSKFLSLKEKYQDLLLQ